MMPDAYIRHPTDDVPATADVASFLFFFSVLFISLSLFSFHSASFAALARALVLACQCR